MIVLLSELEIIEKKFGIVRAAAIGGMINQENNPPIIQ
jgi:hypothetical protein